MSDTRTIIRDFVGALRTPSSRDEAAYDFLVIAVAHAVLGAAAISLLGMWGWTLLPAYIVKEIKDIRRGGDLADSVMDTGFVVLGAVINSPPLWLGAALMATVAREMRRKYGS